MDSTKELVSSLTQLGLNNYEARVYLGLVTEGISTAKNISDITGIPYGKVYEIISSLRVKGFCSTIPSKPMKCKAHPPQKAIEKTKQDMEQKIHRLQEHINTSLSPLFNTNKHFSEPRKSFWMITGRINIIRKVEDLIRGAEKQIFIHASEYGLVRLCLYKQELKDAQHRGVDIRIAGSITDRNREELATLSFCHLRHTTRATTNFYSFDAQTCLLVDPVPDDESIISGRDVGITSQNETFTKFMDESFQTRFDSGKKLDFAKNSPTKK